MTLRNVLNGGEIAVEYLVRPKVPYVSGLCGHGIISFMDALYGREDIKTISVHHETVPGYSFAIQPTARAAGGEGVRIDRAVDIGDAIRAGIAANRPYLIDVNIAADINPGGAGVWELPGIGRSKPVIGGRHEIG